jgi:hypothetical protein
MFFDYHNTMEVIDLGLNDLETVSIHLNDNDISQKPSVNFGSGIELLMNDKKKSSSNNIHMDLGELDSLENELNELSGSSSRGNGSSGGSSGGGGETKTLSGFASNLFGFGGFTESPKKVTITEESTDSNLGQGTRESVGNTKTWDGYSKVNEIPMFDSSRESDKMNDREKRRKKRLMLKKLDEWYEKGLIKHNTHLTLESAYEEIEDEYETAMEDKRKKDSVKLQGWWFMTFINSMEYANAIFNPFDLNLDGWGEQVSEDLDSYEEIFCELHDKYKGGKLAPEISLLLRVAFSAAVLNFSNKALSSATPAFNDVIKQSPELMRMFTNATVSSMSQQSPGFAFANNLMQEEANRPRGPPPPAPVETKSQAPPPRPGMVYTNTPPSNRPDIGASRSAMFREPGVEINQGFASATQPQSMRSGIPQPPPYQKPQQQQQQQRPEMRGPQSSDIDNILAGLKTRSVNIHEESSFNGNATENDSLISIASLKDLQNTTLPKSSSRRRNKSDKNTISLDI